MMIRYITASDLAEIETLDEKCFPDDVRFNRYTFDFYLSQPNSIGLVQVLDDKLLGFVISMITPNGTANIITIDVDPVYRRRGVGSSLITNVKNILKKWKINKIGLQVAIDNKVAMSFYSNHGFKVIKKLPKYYPKTDGYQMECIIL